MNALWHIIIKSTKNKLLDLLKKPAKLILYLIVVAAISAYIIWSLVSDTFIAEYPSPLGGLALILFGFVGIFVIMSVIQGTRNGGAIFEMNDVSLLFVSPVSPRKVLLYGILRLVKTSFFSGFFILFQGGTLGGFGIGPSGVWIAMGGYMSAILVLSIVSLAVYSFTNSNPRRKQGVKIALMLMVAPLLAIFAINFLDYGYIGPALDAVVESPFFTFFPIAGWTATGIVNIFAGYTAIGLAFLAGNLVFGGIITAYILLSNPDYYEDTLVATETAFEKLRAAEEGNLGGVIGSERKVKVAKTGVGGAGASAMFYKHLRETFRTNRLGFLSTFTLITIPAAIVLAFLDVELVMILQILMWIQLFAVGTGRGLQETYQHYLYMIPESSFKKIIWSNMESIFKTMVQGALIFLPAGLILGANPLIILGCFAVFVLFTFMIIGINYPYLRFTGANMGNGLLLTIYFASIIIVIAPGLLAALIVGNTIGGTFGQIVGLGILATWQLLAGAGCFYLGRGVLDKADMPNIRPKQ
ncbi:MAG: putative ABC exporter domain-containing protein [Defluviitaleaceae bacterium]|nr:putative ABC exporter domain-containing protein [Defluviitaleaceae bacterium]